MEELLWPRVITAFLVDGSLSVLCGLLLSSVWMGSVARRCKQAGTLTFGLSWFAGVLLLGSSLQLVLLAVSFGGDTSLQSVMKILPDVCGMHVGVMMTGLCVTAGVLCAMPWVRPERLRNTLCGLMVLVCLGLRGSVGHAAVDGLVSVAAGLQWVHLLGTALWSGGVVVSGLLVIPRLTRRPIEGNDFLKLARDYLGRLSWVSTWAVGLVVVSGVVKGCRATDGNFSVLRSSSWGVLLMIKVAVVSVTILLGARNRWLLRSKAPWDGAALQRVMGTLQIEAVAMLMVLLLSAWLANSPPPM